MGREFEGRTEMRISLTRDFVKKVPIPNRPVDYRDTRLKGLILRVMPTGVKSWYCEYARAKRVWLGRVDAVGYSEAFEAAQKILSEFYRGIDPIEARKPAPDVPTLCDFLDGDYAIWARANQRAHEQNLGRLKTTFKSLLAKKMDAISALDIERWRGKQVERGLSHQTLNRDISSIKACFNRAVDWEILDRNPITKVKKARTDDRVKVRFLSGDEEERLRNSLDQREERRRQERASANAWRIARGYEPLRDMHELQFTDHLKPLVLLSINTGARRGELFDLTWENVDLDRRLMTVSGMTAKSKRTRHIPLNREATWVLKCWREQTEKSSGLVFVNDDGQRFDRANTSWRGLLKQAEIVNFRWHDMRHHFASRLVMGGVDLNTVRELLGHSDYDMTLRYAHLAPEHKMKAVEVLDRQDLQVAA